MANVVSELVAVLTLDSTDFNKGIEKVDKGMGEIASHATKAGEAVRKGLTAAFMDFAKTAFPLIGVTAAVNALVGAQQNLYNAQKASKEMGIPANEYEAWGRAAENLGYSAQDAKGSILGLQQSLQEAALTGRSQAAGVLTYLGVSLFKANGQMKSASEVLKSLSNVLSKMPIEKARAYGQMMGISPSTIALLREGKELSKELAEQLATGPTNEQAERAFETQKAWNRLKQTGGDLAREIFMILSPSLLKFFGIAKDVSRFLADHSEFVTYGAAALLLSTQFGKLAIAFQLVGAVGAKAILAISAAMRANPIVLIITAIIGALNSLGAWFNGESSVIGSFFESFGIKAEHVKNVLKGLANFVKDLFSPFITFANFIGGLFENLPTSDQTKKDSQGNLDAVFGDSIKHQYRGDKRGEQREEPHIDDRDKERTNPVGGYKNLIVDLRDYREDMKNTQKESRLPPSVINNRNNTSRSLQSTVHNEVTINAPSGNANEIQRSVQKGISGGMSDLNGLISNFETGYISK